MLRSLLNPVFEKVTADLLTTDDITDKTDGQAWETLREAGYEKGDFVPLLTVNNNSARSFSFTSTTYVDKATYSSHRAVWSNVGPAESLAASLHMAANSSTGDEVITVRVRNLDARENVLPATSQSENFSLDIPPTNYDPSNPGEPERYRIQAKTEPGVDSATVAQFVLSVGVII